MEPGGRSPELHLEGENDLHSILHLLAKHGLNGERDEATRQFRLHNGPIFRTAGSVEALLRKLTEAIPLSVEAPIGFVIDADTDFAARWESVANRLHTIGGTPPPPIGPEGLIFPIPKFRTKVGVWLMPDNQNHGALEDFLRSLIPDEDNIINHAEESTDVASQLGATFRAVDRLKAVLHTWLAWQSNPGRPYGTAINSEYFNHNRQAAANFVNWFRKLYDLAPNSAVNAG